MNQPANNFNIRKISWAHFNEMQSVSPESLLTKNRNEDNIRLENILIAGVSDLAEVNLGILLGFRTQIGLHVRFRSLFENRDIFARVSTQINLARNSKIPVSIGGAYRVGGHFYATHFKIGASSYNFLQEGKSYKFQGKRIALAQMIRTPLAQLIRANSAKPSVRVTGQVLSHSGLGSDYSYVILSCLIAAPENPASKMDVVFIGKGADRDKFVDINANLDWAQEQGIPVELGGDYNGEYFHAFYFKIKPDKNTRRAGELISLQ